MKRTLLTTVLIFTMLISWFGIASGHAAVVWAYVEKGKVYVEAFFPSGAKIQNARVVVVDATGKALLEGKTDKEGKFSYEPLSKNSQTIVVSAGESHMGDFEITAEDFNENP